MRALLIPALLIAGAAQAADADYRHARFLGTGFSDKQIAPDVWRVKGSAHAEGDGVAVALYRAAELAVAARADEVRVVKQQVKRLTVSQRFGGGIISFTETATVTVRAVRTDADRAACEEAEPGRCMTLPVAGLLARYGDGLGQPAARPGEAPARPVTLVTYDRRWGWPAPVATPVRASPGLALLLGRLAASARERPAAAAPVAEPVASPLSTATATSAALVPLPAGLQRQGPAIPKLSPAEAERARLSAAAATDGDPRGGVVVR